MSRLHATRAGWVVTIELGDGARRNALGEQDWHTLAELIGQAVEDGARAVVLVGHDGTFSAGSDLSEWDGADRATVERTFDAMERCFRSVEDAPIPVVAAVGGVAAGAGCQLALACDIVVMAESARIGMPIARLGIVASPGFAARVANRVGPAVAADLYLTGRLLDAHEARSAGLVARVVPDAEAPLAAAEIAAQIASVAPAAARAAKDAIHKVSQPERTIRCGQSAPTVVLADFHSAVRSFLTSHRRSA